MQENLGENKIPTFDPQKAIGEHNTRMVTSPDADGNTIPTFKDFITTLTSEGKIVAKEVNKETLDKLVDIYNSVIYSRPRPMEGNVFDNYQIVLDDLLEQTLKKEENLDLSGFTVDLGEGVKFNPGKGEFHNPNEKESDYRKKEIHDYLTFREKNNF